MSIEELIAAQQAVMDSTPNATCPCCTGTNWRGLAAFDHMFTSGIVAADVGADDTLTEDVIPDLFQLGWREQRAIGIFCTQCGFVRFHVPLPDGI